MPRAPKLAALALLLCGIAWSAPAQTPPQTAPQTPGLQPVLPAPKLTLTLEQRHVLRELMKDAKPQSIADVHPPAIGDTVPSNVDLKPLPGEIGAKIPQVKSHRFFVADGEIVIVDPKDNKVADLIKLESD